MNPFEMVLGIVLILGVVSIVKHRSAAHRASSGRQEHEQAREDARRIRELEERVRVLETIITDRRADLKREIDRL